MKIAVYCGSAAGNREAFTIGAVALGIDGKPCVLYDLDGFYQPLKKVFEKMIDSGFAYQEDFRNVLISSDIEEIGAFIEKRRIEKK